ncbi:MAG TPA: hypothetical protein VLE22_13305, partial [Bryobacteraceae bacterium]|nr:hypothetical protein [Bryobacteraceae bacterium]
MRDADRNDAGEASDNCAERDGWRLRGMSPKLGRTSEECSGVMMATKAKASKKRFKTGSKVSLD